MLKHHHHLNICWWRIVVICIPLNEEKLTFILIMQMKLKQFICIRKLYQGLFIQKFIMFGQLNKIITLCTNNTSWIIIIIHSFAFIFFFISHMRWNLKSTELFMRHKHISAKWQVETCSANETEILFNKCKQKFYHFLSQRYTWLNSDIPLLQNI